MSPHDFSNSARTTHLRPSANRIPLGPLPVVAARDRLDPLVRRLALDRLRDLRDDGVTREYVGRIYGVSAERIRELERELRG
jgi:hypothetical protein